MRKGLTALINAEPDMEVCGEAVDCAAATSSIAKLKPAVVVVDISLRGNSGIELVKNIKALDSGICSVVLSVHDESVYAMRALKAGAKAYVMKHDASALVVDAIRRTQQGQLYFSERVTSQMLNKMVKGDSGTSDSPVSNLTDRELEIANLIGSGLGTSEIALRLHISVKTIETHRAHIKSKLNLSTATQLAQFCVRWVEDAKRVHAAGA